MTFQERCILQAALHPVWGACVVTGCLFTTAPRTVLRTVIGEADAELSDTGYYQRFESIPSL